MNASEISNGIDEIDFFGMKLMMKKFLIKNAVNFTAVYLLVMIEV